MGRMSIWRPKGQWKFGVPDQSNVYLSEPEGMVAVGNSHQIDIIKELAHNSLTIIRYYKEA